MVDPTPAFDWLTERWRAFYRANPPAPPERFGRREFGFLFFGKKFFLRHTGFRRRNDFDRFFTSRAPAHAYYSTAFYKEPAAARMQEKGWLGAELVFDLDADHVPGSERLPYDEQLAMVKEHFVRLVDEFLLEEFGFEENEVILTFSGGRGYHAHVLAPAAMQMSANERREIVDYITATGLDVKRFLARKTVGAKGRGPYAKSIQSLRIAPADTPGWGGRLNRELVGYLTRLRALDDEERRRELEALPGVGPKKGEELSHEILRLDMDRVQAEGYLSQGSRLMQLVDVVLEDRVVPLAKGETDEPVTSDTKRLIRLPGSLHGKTGLKVVELTRDDLADFDPLTEAVAFGDEVVKVRVGRPISFVLQGEAYDLKPDGVVLLPEAAAVMAMARGCALPARDT